MTQHNDSNITYFPNALISICCNVFENFDNDLFPSNPYMLDSYSEPMSYEELATKAE